MVEIITPAGLPPAASADDAHIIVAMLAGLAQGLTMAQVAERVRQIIVDDGDVALDSWVEVVGLIRANEDGVAALLDAIALKAPLASPALTGTPTAPTAAAGTNTAQLATTAFVAEAAKINGLTAKATPVDADEFRIWDSVGLAFKKVSLANIKAAISAVFTKSYVSAEQSITAGAVLTLAHSLGAAPKSVELFLVCNTGEYGYSAADILPFSFNIDGSSRGCICRTDATNVYVHLGSAAQTFMVSRRNAPIGDSAPIINANWRIVVKAYA